MKFGFELFAGNGRTKDNSYIMLSDKKNVTDAVTQKLIIKVFENRGIIDRWNGATDEERANTVKAMKYRVRPVAIEYSYSSTGVKFLEVKTLQHAHDAESSRGCAVVPESYFDEYIIFDEV